MSNSNQNNVIDNYIEDNLPDSSFIEAKRLREVLKYLFNNFEGGGSGSGTLLSSIINKTFGQNNVPEELGLEKGSILEHLLLGIKPRVVNIPNGKSINNYIKSSTEALNGSIVEVKANEIVIFTEKYIVGGESTYNGQKTYILSKGKGKYGVSTNTTVSTLLESDFILIANNYVNLTTVTGLLKTVMEVEPNLAGNVDLKGKVILMGKKELDITENPFSYKYIPLVDSNGNTYLALRSEFIKEIEVELPNFTFPLNINLSNREFNDIKSLFVAGLKIPTKYYSLNKTTKQLTVNDFTQDLFIIQPVNPIANIELY